ncbi:glycosyltransferase [Sporomusa malonica]|uniref:glycosyltransferase n=1 Tax=Sporomusa malonica TaxID=112901 RepID=UPI002481993D|nr:glycosyltransferase [Sporomusa malonica]
MCVGVLSYNHEKYITQCLKGIVQQTGNFKLKVIICDDCSSDNTIEIIEKFIECQSNSTVNFTVIKNENNIGVSKNLGQCVRLCKEADYFAFCEGDDYWIPVDKLQTQMEFLINNPRCSICFNSIIIYYENEKRYELYQTHQQLQQTIYTTKDLVLSNFIGNFSCCFYNAKFIKFLENQLFDNLFTVDWMFNIVYSEFGDIGYINKPMSIYRKHSNGIWSSMNLANQAHKLIQYIDEYNKFLNYRHDAEFTKYRNKCLCDTNCESFQLVIVDDVFPHPISSFRYQEFLSYLQAFDSVKIFTSGASVKCLGNQSIDDLIINFKREYPDFTNNIEKYNNRTFQNMKCNLLYFVFLSNAYTYLRSAEVRQIPFVFTLYPGGAFALNNPSSDAKLRRVVSSPYFRRVIVTQKITYDYLINNKFCTPEQIEYLFGVVTPLDRLKKDCICKIHYGFEKDRLDICFVAHRYTAHGEDKGYDVFIKVAKLLFYKYNNVYFHVVGSFNDQIIDVSTIKDRITFYGVQQQEWFDEFYRDKDIILSPNISGRIFAGSFDGFPTASCTDAGLRKVAIFCTDPLNLNNCNFIEGEEIVIIEYDVDNIIEKLSYYYDHPDKLRGVCEKGYAKIRDNYSYEKQIRPRIDLITKELKGI